MHIETSTFDGSIALSSGREVLNEIKLPAGEKYIQTLPTSTEHLLKGADIGFEDLKGIAISAGPGSYTGLRIGTSFAKGLCFGLSIPLLTVPTLQVLVEAIFDQHTTEVAVPLMDARRMEVYATACQANGTELLPVSAMVVNEESFTFLKGRQCVFAGNGSAKCKQLLEVNPGFRVDEQIELRAGYMANWATEAFENKSWEDLAVFEPLYLKEFQVGKSSKISSILKG